MSHNFDIDTIGDFKNLKEKISKLNFPISKFFDIFFSSVENIFLPLPLDGVFY